MGTRLEPSPPAHPVLNQRKTLICFTYSRHLNLRGIIPYLSFMSGSVHVSTMFSRFVRVVPEFYSILWLSNIPLYAHHILVNHSSAKERLGCFHFGLLGIVLLWTWVCRCPFKSLLSILWGTFLGVKLLNKISVYTKIQLKNK